MRYKKIKRSDIYCLKYFNLKKYNFEFFLNIYINNIYNNYTN
ncbi:MAG: hypothetical protein Q8830_00080 [Candidatus Phytoplasma australasiaticum]|nr:hypothetical protein [Candidatus Phytoplasma australasiaticum]